MAAAFKCPRREPVVVVVVGIVSQPIGRVDTTWRSRPRNFGIFLKPQDVSFII
jgi:hypothetical protein